MLLDHVEAILDTASRTPPCGPRDEWIGGGVFDAARDHALGAYDRIIGLDLSEVAIDGSLHKAPCGGEGTGKNPTDRGKLGGSGRSPPKPRASPSGGPSTEPTATTSSCSVPPSRTRTVTAASEIETVHLDRGYDYPVIRTQLSEAGLSDLDIHGRTKPGDDTTANKPLRLGLRWVVESTNSWLSNYGQLRRNTDRQSSIATLSSAWSPPC